jgi:UDP-N-acetylglucosamine 1-carboxyvinyltransferase
MDRFEIEGPVQLQGGLHPQGAKNEALQVLTAVLLTKQPVVLRNIPLIRDVLQMIDLLKGLGVAIERLDEHSFRFQARDLNLDYLQSLTFSQLGGSLRGSVMVMGPLLARFGRATIARPGGDKIGRRRLDTHFFGLRKLGAEIAYDPQRRCYVGRARQLQGTYIFLDEPSVTGTANIVMAAAMASGQTTIYNAACEPYVQQLCRMLNRMGAQIEGIGTNLLKVDGVPELDGCEHRCLPDMIEIGSFMALAALTRSPLTIHAAGVEHLGQIPAVFEKLGMHLEFEGDAIVIPAQTAYEIATYMDGSILTVSDGPWPGFTPDLLSVALVMATQAKGNVLIHQKMFESRLFFVDNLIDMGAQIILCDPHRATVMGMNHEHPLKGIRMRSPDIRAGVALLIAALSAEGKSVVYNIDQIDRGYERIDERLNAIGAHITRLSD